jgi:hypothetical protein
MLDKAFMARLFDQIESSSDEQLIEKIDAVERVARSFPKGSEALVDARFMLKHMRRHLLERQFQPRASS